MMQDKHNASLSNGDQVRYTGPNIESRGISTGTIGKVKGGRWPFHILVEFSNIIEKISRMDLEKV